MYQINKHTFFKLQDDDKIFKLLLFLLFIFYLLKYSLRNNNCFISTADVTIDDFANTLRIRARLKKSVTNISNKGKKFVY